MTYDDDGHIAAIVDWIDANPLRLWLDDHPEQNQRFLSSRIGVSPVSVNHWLKGVKTPSEDNMLKLELVTGLGMTALWHEWEAQRPEMVSA